MNNFVVIFVSWKILIRSTVFEIWIIEKFLVFWEKNFHTYYILNVWGRYHFPQQNGVLSMFVQSNPITTVHDAI